MANARMMLGVLPLVTAICLVMGWLLPPPCFIKAVTGMSCPSCGTWRSLEFFFRGDFESAFVSNPLFLYWDFLFALFFVQATIDLAGLPVNWGGRYLRFISRRRPLVVLHFLVFLGTCIYKNI